MPQYDPESEFLIDEDNVQKTYIEAFAETAGTWQEWAEGMKKFRKRNLFRFIMATSFASPLLEIVGCRNFGVYNYADSRAR